MLMDTIFE
ncbi:unnamed protein product [Cuscuta europaea]|uniref:Uncharacterized protein n=1 Tax=Cuscuta europaea TaxID=41803 RepID=A0A9P0YUI5_CUSEU|nr:unnamed protein product [Cuscuta europaea]